MEEQKLSTQHKKIILCGICALDYHEGWAIIEDKAEHVSTLSYVVDLLLTKTPAMNKHQI